MNRMMQGFVMASGLVLAVLAVSSPAAAQDGNTFPTTVTVYSHRPVSVVVYLDQGEFDTRLGTVPAESTKIIDLPKYLNENASADVVLHPEGGGDLVNHIFELKPGGHLLIEVPTH